MPEANYTRLIKDSAEDLASFSAVDNNGPTAVPYFPKGN